MNVLVTGGAGFIGSHVVESLLNRKDKVVCIDNLNDYYSPEIKEKNLAQFRNNSNFKFYKEDIININELKKIFSVEKFDKVIHLAARAGVRPSLVQPNLYVDTNINGTLNILELSKEFNIKNFIFASSSSVYGNSNKVPLSEEDCVDFPISPLCSYKEILRIIMLHLLSFIQSENYLSKILYSLWSKRSS